MLLWVLVYGLMAACRHPRGEGEERTGVLTFPGYAVQYLGKRIHQADAEPQDPRGWFGLSGSRTIQGSNDTARRVSSSR